VASFGVVLRSVPVQSIDLEEKGLAITALIRENRHIIGNHWINNIAWLKAPASGQLYASLVVKYKESEAANAAIAASRLCWNGEMLRTERFHRECRTSRCMRCNRYGHVVPQCPNDEICGHCASKEHGTKECHSMIRKCCLCDGEHKAWSPDCPHFHQEKKRLEQARALAREQPFWPEEAAGVSPGPSEISSRRSQSSEESD